MIWKGWNNGSKLASGAGYGLKISPNDRDSHFNKNWNSVTIKLHGASKSHGIDVSITDSFWRNCSELRSQEIGKWLISNGYAPWPKGSPPQFNVELVGDRVFQVNEL